MKNPSKALTLLLASAVFLTTCDGDKPAEPKPEPQKPAPAQTAPTQDTADKSATDTPKADEKTQTTTETTAQTAPQETGAAKDDAKPDDTAKSEQAPAKAEAPKPKVQALSLEEGKARYEKTCKVCHDQGLLNAPKLTATADWAKRLEKGVDTLHTHSAKGFNKMPAQATGDVSEAEVYAAVDYMISQVKK